MFEFIFYVIVLCMGGAFFGSMITIGRLQDERMTQHILEQNEKLKDIERRKKFNIDVK